MRGCLRSLHYRKHAPHVTTQALTAGTRFRAAAQPHCVFSRRRPITCLGPRQVHGIVGPVLVSARVRGELRTPHRAKPFPSACRRFFVWLDVGISRLGPVVRPWAVVIGQSRVLGLVRTDSVGLRPLVGVTRNVSRPLARTRHLRRIRCLGDAMRGISGAQGLGVARRRPRTRLCK